MSSCKQYVFLNCSEKAKLFNDFFSNQCIPITTSSVLPPINLLTDKTIDHISVPCDEIISLILNLNPNKATGSDGVSGPILFLCDNSRFSSQNNLSKYIVNFYLP